jgi:hypothetical protein
VLELDDILVVDGAVYLDLAHELLLGATLGEGGLLDDLGSLHQLRLLVYEFIALGEAALPQELALQVLTHLHLTVVLHDLLLYDYLLLVYFHSITILTYGY